MTDYRNFVRTVLVDCSAPVPAVVSTQVQAAAHLALGTSGTYARGPRSLYSKAALTSVVAGPPVSGTHTLNLQTFDPTGALLAETSLLADTGTEAMAADLYGLYLNPADPTEVSAMICYQNTGDAAPTVAQVKITGVGTKALTTSTSATYVSLVGSTDVVWLYGATDPYSASPGLLYGLYDDTVFPLGAGASVSAQSYADGTQASLGLDPLDPDSAFGTPMGKARYVFEVTGLPWGTTGQDTHQTVLQVLDYSTPAAPSVTQVPLPTDFVLDQDPVDDHNAILTYLDDLPGGSSTTALDASSGLVLHARNMVQDTRYAENLRYSTVLWLVAGPQDNTLV